MTTKNQPPKYKLAGQAHGRVAQAIKDGALVRPASCEICGKSPEPINSHGLKGGKHKCASICAHHWRGYNHPLDVFFVCRSCNSRMKGDRFHNGTISLETIKEVGLMRLAAIKPPQIMPSKVKQIAQSKGIMTSQELSYAARVTYPTCANVWTGDLANVWADTLHKVAQALDCTIDDLYTATPTT